MAMERIPQEILQNIIDYLIGEGPPEYLLPYVTVSRRWQHSIEPLYFRRLRIESPDLSTFANLFRESQAHRKALVERVALHIVLPDYDGDNFHQLEEANNQVFSADVHKLFWVLESFNEDEGVKKGEGLSLELFKAYSRFDKLHEYDLLWPIIRLLDYEKLPTLSCVSDFHCSHGWASRRVDPVTWMFFASKLKGLKRGMGTCYQLPQNISIEARKAMRHDLTKAVTACNHPLGDIHLELGDISPIDEASAPPNFIPFPATVDPLNLALHKCIQEAHISGIKLFGEHIISPEFFWPYGDINVTPTALAFWPNLKSIQLSCSPATPDGDWYFLGDPNIASHAEFTGAAAGNNPPMPHQLEKEYQLAPHDSQDSENTFRSIPNPNRMNPLLIAMARAVRYAPSLWYLYLDFTATLSPKFVRKTKKGGGMKRVFCLFYLTTSESDVCGESSKKTRLILEVGDWRVDEEVERYWMDALGPDGVIIYS